MKAAMIFVMMVFTYATTEAQTPDLPSNNDGRVEYSEVVAVDSVNAEKLFSKSKLVINDLFKSGKDVLQLVDEASKTIIVKGTAPVKIFFFLVNVSGSWAFQLSISCKDNKYKYSITDFVFRYQPGTNEKIQETAIENENQKVLGKKKWVDMKQQLVEIIVGIVAEIKNKMKPNKDDNW